MKPKCPHCGANPVPHFLNWTTETIIVLLTPVNMALFGNRFFKFIARGMDKVFSIFQYCLTWFGFFKFHGDHTQAIGDRGRVLWEEANRRNIKMESAKFLGLPMDFYRATIKNKTIYFNGLPRPQWTEKGTEWWIDDKAILKNKLNSAGIPIAQGGSFSDYKLLQKCFETLQKPVIIKPRLGSRGRHTTTFIYNESELKRAYDIAKQLCHWVILEEHLTGSVYRGTVINGKLAGVLAGDPPRITGDGIGTIEQLIKTKNQNKNPKIKDVIITPGMDIFLRRNNLKLTDILPPGKTIDLSEKIGISYGGHSAEVTETTHPETITILERAAKAIGDPIIGFDFIIANIVESPTEQKWGIIECNGMPFINLHHDPLEGKPKNVAKHVWDFVEENIHLF